MQIAKKLSQLDTASGAAYGVMHKIVMTKLLLTIICLLILTGCGITENSSPWPNDVNGDVFRSLERHGFEFEKEHLVDINLDFDHWPLTDAELTYVKSIYPGVVVISPEEGEDTGNGVDVGYLQFQVKTLLTYEYITDLQVQVTEKVSSIGGWCNSWGVMQE